MGYKVYKYFIVALFAVISLPNSRAYFTSPRDLVFYPHLILPEKPTLPFCREKMSQPLPCGIIPWWYYVCQWLIAYAPKPSPKSTTSTVHPYFKKVLENVNKFKKRTDIESHSKIIIIIQITQIYPRKRKFLSSSDESIDNFVYFKDCPHKQTQSSVAPAVLRHAFTEPPKQQPDCPFPRMCCALTCGNECENQQLISRQMQPLQQNNPVESFKPQIPVQPQLMQRGKKKVKPIKLPPIGNRRDFGFTKERIKSLISQDEDIRKILKDLVRVTMKKVDVMEMINANKNTATTEQAVENINDDYE